MADAAADVAHTPLHAAHVSLGARLTPFAGFDMPLSYDGFLVEHARVREAVGLFDVSHMGEVHIQGPDALAAANRLVTNDLVRLGTGRAQYSCLCAEDGTIVDDLIVYKLADDDIWICVNAANRHGDVAHMRAHLSGDATLVDESDAWAQIAVQGPRAPELLGRLFGDKAARTKPFRIRTVRHGDITARLATTGYTGERGGEIYARNEDAPALWDALLRLGEDLGVGPCGLAARDTLRLEMAYCLYGNDIDRTTTPLEAGLGWVVKLDGDDFVGKAALVEQAAAGVTRKLVGVELLERGIPRHGYPVLADGEPVGAITSGTKSPTTGRAIGLAYVPISLADPGAEISVDVRGRAKRARVVETPFYTPAG